MTRQQAQESADQPKASAVQIDLRPAMTHATAAKNGSTETPPGIGTERPRGPVTLSPAARTDVLRDATLICQAAVANGERISQRSLARQLRDHGHRFPNERLNGIALTIGLTEGKAA